MLRKLKKHWIPVLKDDERQNEQDHHPRRQIKIIALDFKNLWFRENTLISFRIDSAGPDVIFPGVDGFFKRNFRFCQFFIYQYFIEGIVFRHLEMIGNPLAEVTLPDSDCFFFQLWRFYRRCRRRWDDIETQDIRPYPLITVSGNGTYAEVIGLEIKIFGLNGTVVYICQICDDMIKLAIFRNLQLISDGLGDVPPFKLYCFFAEVCSLRR